VDRHSIFDVKMPPATQSATQCTTADHKMLIRVYDEAGNVIETREDKGEFKQP
jgi:hypothetical protein